MTAPEIKPINTKEYSVKQSKYGDVVPKLPTRATILAPSFSGKTVLISNLILDVYRNCFNRIYIFSPTINIDDNFKPVKEYITNEIKPHEREQIYFDHYDPNDLQAIIDKQYKVVEYQKSQGHKQLFQIAIFIDDFAESQEFLRNSKLLHALYTKGRHANISTITSVQMYKSLAPIIRKNATAIFIFRLRNQGDMDAILDELGALADKKTIQKIYNLATARPHSFLYINLMSHNINEMFYINFKQQVKVRKV
jgi:hypothetical protein